MAKNTTDFHSVSRSQSENRVVISIKQRSQTREHKQDLLSIHHMLDHLHSPGAVDVCLRAKKNTSGFGQI